MTTEQTTPEEEDPKDVSNHDFEPVAVQCRRPTRRNIGLSSSLNAGTVLSPRRTHDAALKSSFTSDNDRRAGLAGTHGRLSQSFIEMSGEGLDRETIDDILKDLDDEDVCKKDESVSGEIKRTGPRHGLSIDRRPLLRSIESQKSMHFSVQDDDP
ncbi:hypothetical protein HJC23_006425 [Cyclotella cryptica]|uniref:Uncharacterized protein n=1 Tax=Cyclotella cryptica TaxID=29204 RepID=A0ABD3QV08_9STRA|eukprot:CCRYP_001827-RA/>CCRYP_001827-RA protein AED:0.25 eAED:0.25 QI:0/-1/0/1/-1/1/1/0/154